MVIRPLAAQMSRRFGVWALVPGRIHSAIASMFFRLFVFSPLIYPPFCTFLGHFGGLSLAWKPPKTFVGHTNYRKPFPTAARQTMMVLRLIFLPFSSSPTLSPH